MRGARMGSNIFHFYMCAGGGGEDCGDMRFVGTCYVELGSCFGSRSDGLVCAAIAVDTRTVEIKDLSDTLVMGR